MSTTKELRQMRFVSGLVALFAGLFLLITFGLTLFAPSIGAAGFFGILSGIFLTVLALAALIFFAAHIALRKIRAEKEKQRAFERQQAETAAQRQGSGFGVRVMDKDEFAAFLKTLGIDLDIFPPASEKNELQEKIAVNSEKLNRVRKLIADNNSKLAARLKELLDGPVETNHGEEQHPPFDGLFAAGNALIANLVAATNAHNLWKKSPLAVRVREILA